MVALALRGFFPRHPEHGKSEPLGALLADSGQFHEGFDHPAQGLARDLSNLCPGLDLTPRTCRRLGRFVALAHRRCPVLTVAFHIFELNRKHRLVDIGHTEPAATPLRRIPHSEIRNF